jgi:hypothetical protein
VRELSTKRCSKVLHPLSHDAVIRVYDNADNVIETHEHKGDFKENIVRDRNLDDQGQSKSSVFLRVLQIFPRNSGT